MNSFHYCNLNRNIKTIILVDGIAYQVLLCYDRKYCLLTFETAQESMDFYDFALHGKACIKEQRNSLFEKVKFNVDVIFDSSKYIYFDDLIVQILIRQNKDTIDRTSLHKSLDISNLNTTAYRLAAGFFMQSKRKNHNLCTVMEFIGKLYNDCIRRRLKTADENLCYIIHTSLISLMGYADVLAKLQIIDYRIDIIFNCLINIYKKLFFNTTSKIIINVIEKLVNPTYLIDAEGKHTYMLFMDFFKELKNFIDQFAPLASHKGFSSIIAEFIRKHVYVFVNHTTNVITQNIYNLSEETYFVLLDGIFYLIREMDKMYAYLQSKFGNNGIVVKGILNFKKAFLGMGEALYNHLIIKIDADIDKCGIVDVETFDFDIFLKTKISFIYDKLQTLHNYYSLKILRHIMFTLSKKVVTWVRLKGNKWIQDHLKEKVKEYNEYFTVTMKSQNFDNFAKFFDNYRIFVFTKSVDSAETLLAMMVNILGERLDKDTVSVMIKTRLDDTFGFQGIKLRDIYSTIIDNQAKGEAKIQAKQINKKRISHLLSVFLVSVKFIGKHRVKVKSYRSTKVININVNHNSASSMNRINYNIEPKTTSAFKMIFVRNPEYYIYDDQAVINEIKNIYVKSAVFKYSFHFSNDTVFLLDERSKVVKLYFLAKFDELQLININNKPCVLLSYARFDKLLVSSSKQHKIDSVLKLFSDVLSKTKNLKLNSQELVNKN